MHTTDFEDTEEENTKDWKTDTCMLCSSGQYGLEVIYYNVSSPELEF